MQAGTGHTHGEKHLKSFSCNNHENQNDIPQMCTYRFITDIPVCVSNIMVNCGCYQATQTCVPQTPLQLFRLALN